VVDPFFNGLQVQRAPWLRISRPAWPTLQPATRRQRCTVLPQESEAFTLNTDGAGCWPLQQRSPTAPAPALVAACAASRCGLRVTARQRGAAPTRRWSRSFCSNARPAARAPVLLPGYSLNTASSWRAGVECYDDFSRCTEPRMLTLTVRVCLARTLLPPMSTNRRQRSPAANPRAASPIISDEWFSAWTAHVPDVRRYCATERFDRALLLDDAHGFMLGLWRCMPGGPWPDRCAVTPRCSIRLPPRYGWLVGHGGHDELTEWLCKPRSWYFCTARPPASHIVSKKCQLRS
jgi:hypothetical protein